MSELSDWIIEGVNFSFIHLVIVSCMVWVLVHKVGDVVLIWWV